jgi:hypothetical protein
MALMARSPALAAAAIGAVIAIAASCRQPTDLTIELATDVDCGEVDDTVLSVGELGDNLETKPPSISTRVCEGKGMIGTVVLTPSGADDEEVAFRVVLGIGKLAEDCTSTADTNCIFARRSLRYRPHEATFIHVDLDIDCRGVPCGEFETCDHGACVNVKCTDPNSTCPSPTDAGAPETGDGSHDSPPDMTITMSTDGSADAPVDASVVDAFHEATLDAPLDAPPETGPSSRVDGGPDNGFTWSFGCTDKCAGGVSCCLTVVGMNLTSECNAQCTGITLCGGTGGSGDMALQCGQAQPPFKGCVGNVNQGPCKTN